MDVLHHHLETIETSGLWHLDLCCEALCQVLKNYSIGGSEESENMLNEVFLAVSEFFPVLDVLGEVDLFCSPEGSLLILVHLPNVTILNWEQYKSIWILLQKRLW